MTAQTEHNFSQLAHSSPIMNEETILSIGNVLTIMGISRATLTRWEDAGECDGLFFKIRRRKFTTAGQLRKWIGSVNKPLRFGRRKDRHATLQL